MMQAREIIQKLLDREITIEQAVQAINSLMGKALYDLDQVSKHNKELVEALRGCAAQIQSFDPGGCNPGQPHGGRLAQARNALRTERVIV